MFLPRLSLFLLPSLLLPLWLTPAALAQPCPCSCEQSSQGVIGPDGLCQCPCGLVPIPGINAETLSGPPKPPQAGGPTPTWTVEPGYDDDFGGPFWDDWW